MSESSRFIKFIPSEETHYLARKYPNAFILLMFIAGRARREDGHPDGLSIGECHIGDYKEYGLTEKEYRTAKKILVERNHIEIIETCRTKNRREKPKDSFNSQKVENWPCKRAILTTTRGTLVKLCSSTVYDINISTNNQQKGDQKGDRGATEGRPKGDEQEGIRSISKDIHNEEAQTAKRLRSKDLLSFNFEKFEFEGISEKDIGDWKIIYPHIDINIEILKATQWIKNNPSKSNKKQWGKFLTGWLGRTNDFNENKKAYRTATGGASKDRRTQDMHGNPVESPHTGRF